MKHALADRRSVVFTGRVVFLVAIVGLLELAVGIGWIDPQIMAKPSEIVRAGWDLIGEGSFRSAFLLTLWQVALGFVAAVSLGTVGALCAWRWALARRTTMPYILLSNSFPLILLYPVFVVIFGLGTPSIFVLSLALGIMPMFVSTLAGFDGIPRSFFELADSIGCVGWKRATKILFPGARTLMLNGVRQAFVYVLIIVVAAQYILSGTGLGQIIRHSYDLFRVPSLYAAITIIMLISFVWDYALRSAAREH